MYLWLHSLNQHTSSFLICCIGMKALDLHAPPTKTRHLILDQWFQWTDDHYGVLEPTFHLLKIIKIYLLLISLWTFLFIHIIGKFNKTIIWTEVNYQWHSYDQMWTVLKFSTMGTLWHHLDVRGAFLIGSSSTLENIMNDEVHSGRHWIRVVSNFYIISRNSENSYLIQQQWYQAVNQAFSIPSWQNTQSVLATKYWKKSLQLLLL